MLKAVRVLLQVLYVEPIWNQFIATRFFVCKLKQIKKWRLWAGIKLEIAGQHTLHIGYVVTETVFFHEVVLRAFVSLRGINRNSSVRLHQTTSEPLNWLSWNLVSRSLPKFVDIFKFWLKCNNNMKLHGVTLKNIVLFIVTAVRTTDLSFSKYTFLYYFFHIYFNIILF
jgi:hypothetical protein